MKLKAARKRYKVGQLYYIEWLDANGASTWIDTARAINDKERTLIKEVGFVYNMDKEYLHIFSQIDTGYHHFGNRTSIPHDMIIKAKAIKGIKKFTIRQIVGTD